MKSFLIKVLRLTTSFTVGIIAISLVMIFAFVVWQGIESFRYYDKDSASFFDRLEIALNKEGDATLQEKMGVDWQEICFFYAVDSYPDAAYLTYIEHIQNHPEYPNPLPKKNYGMIVLLRETSGQPQVFFTDRTSFKVADKKYWLRFDSDHSNRLNGCLKGNVFISKKNSEIIEIVKE